jgi:hypothetical protein
LNKISSINSKLNLSIESKRLIKYFPELQNKDDFITEFTVQSKHDQLIKEKLTPDLIKFKKPDFGFNDYMTFDNIEEQTLNGKGWRIFMDCVQREPENQRVINYINFIHQKKIEIMKSRLPQIKSNLDSST